MIVPLKVAIELALKKDPPTKEERKAYDRVRYLNNKDTITARNEAYRKSHQEQINAYYREYHKHRKET